MKGVAAAPAGSPPARRALRTTRNPTALNIPGPAATFRVAVPNADLALNELQILLLAAGALILTGFFAVLRSAHSRVICVP